MELVSMSWRLLTSAILKVRVYETIRVIIICCITHSRSEHVLICCHLSSLLF